MIMPGRMFTALTVPGGSVTGTTQVNGFTVPVDLALNSRTGNEPTQYTATRTIDLDEGFESGTDDDVTAFLTDTSYAGTGNGGSGADGVAGASKYRYGFGNKEKDDEIKGAGNSVNFGNRMDDTRGGRWFSTDRITKPWLSPYAFAADNPINNVDPDGKDEIHFHFYTNSVIGPDGKVMGGPTTFRVEVIKANGPDQFFHHAHSNEIRMPTNYSRGGQSTFEKTTEIYPWNPDSRSGFTKSTIAGIIPWNDHDYATLIKYATANPALKEYIKQRSQGAVGDKLTSEDKQNYKGLVEDIPAYNLIGKIKLGAEIAAGALSIVQGGLSVGSGLTIAKASAKSEELVTLFRSISKAEAQSIQSTNMLSFAEGQMEVKQFWQTKEGLEAFNKTGFAGEFNLEITVPKSLLGNGKPLNTATQVDEFFGPTATVDGAGELNTINKNILNLKITPIKK